MVDITPKMTSNTTPSGYVASASSEISTSRQAWTAFDSIAADSENNRWHSAAGMPQWIMLKFPSAQHVLEFSIENCADLHTGITTFELQGSNDGSSFTTLGSYTNPTGLGAVTTFSVQSPGDYLYYRLYITGSSYTSSSQYYAVIEQIRFYIADPLPDGSLSLVDSTVYEITGGAVLISGAFYNISNGRTLVNGTGYDIVLQRMITITLENTGSARGYSFFVIDGTQYEEAQTLTVPAGTELTIRCYFWDDWIAGHRYQYGRIKRNDTAVASASSMGNGWYDYVLFADNDMTVSLYSYYYSDEIVTYYYGSADITDT